MTPQLLTARARAMRELAEKIIGKTKLDVQRLEQLQAALQALELDAEAEAETARRVDDHLKKLEDTP
jgi:hypothetical protein